MALALIAGALAFFILSGGAEPPKRSVVQLLSDKYPGEVIRAEDVRTVQIEVQYTRQSALERVEDAIGKIVLVPRQKGDILLKSDIGDTLPVAPNARLVGIKVSIEETLGGLLKPGDRVTLIASIPMEGMMEQTYTKAFLEGLRVFYVPEEMRPFQLQTEEMKTMGFAVAMQRQPTQEGVIVLEVPVEPVPIVYAYPKSEVTPIKPMSGITESLQEAVRNMAYDYEVRLTSPAEFLAALKAAGAKFTLALMPHGSKEFFSSGLILEMYVPDRMKRVKHQALGGEMK